jgi:hypothetical protein
MPVLGYGRRMFEVVQEIPDSTTSSARNKVATGKRLSGRSCPLDEGINILGASTEIGNFEIRGFKSLIQNPKYQIEARRAVLMEAAMIQQSSWFFRDNGGELSEDV